MGQVTRPNLGLILLKVCMVQCRVGNRQVRKSHCEITTSMVKSTAVDNVGL